MNAARYRLREIEEHDLELLLRWRNSERVRACMYSDHLITAQEHRAWFERLRRERRDFAFLYLADERPLGVMNLNHFDHNNRRCHWGFYLGESDAPPGSGTRMAYLTLAHVFEELGLHKVIGEAFAFNAASIAYHKKLGFSQEGLFVEHVLKNGGYLDVLSFALLSHQWPSVKAALAAKLA